MIDNTELKRLLEGCKESNCADASDFGRRIADLYDYLDPETIAGLVAENERLTGFVVHRRAQADQYDEALTKVADQRDQLKAENEVLRLRCERLDADKQAMAETHVLYTWLRKKCDQPSNDVVAVHMNIGHDWVAVHDLDRDLRTMIDREEP